MNTLPRPQMAKEISCRLTRTLLIYVRTNRGGELGGLLDDLPVDEAYLSDPNNWISHSILQVLYQRMIALLQDENAVYNMTLAAERFQSMGILDRIVRLLDSPKLLYSQAPRYNKFLKLNGSVHIREIGNSWVVLEDRYHDGTQKTRFDCDVTRGILAGIPTMFGLPLAEVEELKCQVAHEKYGRRRWPDHPEQDAEGCCYRVRWKPRGNSLFKRFFLRRIYRRQAVEDLVQANHLIQSKYDEIRRLATDLAATNDQLVQSRQALEARTTALTESERQYRLLAENVSDTIWILNLKTLTFDYISPSVEKIRGYTPEEARALPLDQTLSPASLEKVARMLEVELAHDGLTGINPQRFRTIEIENSAKSGGFVWAEATVSFIRDESGAPSAILGVTRDIAERKQVEMRIAEREEKYRNLFENGSDLICIHDLDGNLLESNLPFKPEYGFTRSDLGGVSIRELIPERYKSEFDDYMARILANGSADGYLKVRDGAGRKVILEYRNRLIRDANGEPRAVQGAARDVTQRIAYEKALKKSEEKNKAIVQHAPAGIFEVDMAHGRFLSANEVMSGYTGYALDELMQMDPFSLFSPESAERARKLFEGTIPGDRNLPPAEFMLLDKYGKERPVLANTRFFVENGTPRIAMMVLHDLTDIRKAEEERRALEVKLQNVRKLESLGTLAGGVAHDLNNILSGIVGYPDLLLHTIEASSPLRKPLMAIRKSGEKAAEIVQDLLTLSRRGVAIKKIVNLNPIVQDFLSSPEYRSRIAGRSDIRLQLQLANGVLNIKGHEATLSKVLMNLVVNAVEAMPAGGMMTVATRDGYLDRPHPGFEVMPRGEYVILEVSDRGIGIAPSDLEKIFEPFYTKKVMGRSGTGLGMSVVWGAIKDHGGFVDIVSEEGSGTAFHLYFPASREEQQASSVVYIDDYLGKGESLLIVDDAPEQRDLLKGMMQRLGYQVDSAASGEDALALLKKKAFHLMILDMIMPPGMDGLDTYRQAIEIVPGQRAVIASGFAESERVHEAQRLGAGPYIKKPFNLEKIGLAVRNELDRKRGEPAAR